MKSLNMKKVLLAAALITPVVAAGTLAVAGSGGTEFDAIATLLVDYLEGGLGTVLAIAAFAIGMAMGVIQQSVMAVVVGIAFAIALNFGPAVLTGIMTSGAAF